MHETSVPHVFCSSTVWGYDYFLCSRLLASIKSLFNRELLGSRGRRRCLMAPILSPFRCICKFYCALFLVKIVSSSAQLYSVTPFTLLISLCKHARGRLEHVQRSYYLLRSVVPLVRRELEHLDTYGKQKSSLLPIYLFC